MHKIDDKFVYKTTSGAILWQCNAVVLLPVNLFLKQSVSYNRFLFIMNLHVTLSVVSRKRSIYRNSKSVRLASTWNRHQENNFLKVSICAQCILETFRSCL